MKPIVSLSRLLMVLTLVMVPLASTAQGGGNDTHMGQFTGRHVFLVGWGLGSTADDFKFCRSKLDGTTEGASFKVPSGQVLVVTDVSWISRGGYSEANASRTLVLSMVNGTSKVAGIYLSILKTDDNGLGIKNEAITSGFLVGPGWEIKLTTGTMGLLDSSVPFYATLRGYLVSDKNVTFRISPAN